MSTRFQNIRNMADVAHGLEALFGENVRVQRLRLTPDVAAAASVTAASTPSNGETITIDDGEGTSVVFEFTTGGGLTVGDVEVDTTSTTDAGMTELATAVNGSGLAITAGTVTGGGPYTMPLTKDTQGTVGNTTPVIATTATLTLVQWAGGVDGNLTAAATTQTFELAALRANSLVVAAAVQVDTDLTGGSVSAATVDVGVSGGVTDKYVSATDVNGSGGGVFQGDPGAGFTGQSGLPFEHTAITPLVTVTTTTDDVAALDAGDVTIWLFTVEPSLA